MKPTYNTYVFFAACFLYTYSGAMSSSPEPEIVTFCGQVGKIAKKIVSCNPQQITILLAEVGHDNEPLPIVLPAQPTDITISFFLPYTTTAVQQEELWSKLYYAYNLCNPHQKSTFNQYPRQFNSIKLNPTDDGSHSYKHKMLSVFISKAVCTSNVIEGILHFEHFEVKKIKI